MCGIGGILRIHPPGAAPPPESSIPESWLDLIDESIKHRGPDGKGRFRDRVTRPDGSTVDVALVHRRLSIIDHKDGWQPMVQGGAALLSREGEPYRETPTHVCPRCAERTRSVSAGPRQPPTPPNAPRASDQSSFSDALSNPALTLGVRPLLAVVFNGCIYNHRELRRELEAAGHIFATDHSDTEVLLHGWSEHAINLFPQLRGMFALAIWDRSRAQLALARDLAGEKPMYLARPPTETGATLVFASAVNGVHRLGAMINPYPSPIVHRALQKRAQQLAHEGVQPLDSPAFSKQTDGPLGMPVTTVDLRGMERAFLERRLATDPRASAFGRVQPWIRFGCSDSLPHEVVGQVAPGSQTLGAPSSEGWEGGRFIGPDSDWIGLTRPEPLTPERVESLLSASVVAQLDADVPIGIMLSGGVDSSLVAHFAQKELRRRGQSAHTFTVRMPESRMDESPFAETVASMLGTTHSTLECEASAGEDLVRLIEMLGLPFGDSSLLPAYWVARAMRRRVKVALGGDGGDELFAGYERYRAWIWIRRLFWIRRAVGALPIPYGPPGSGREKARRLANAGRVGRYDELLAIFETPDFQRLCSDRDHRRSADSFTQRPWWSDFTSYLPNDLLRKSDTASMAVGLELRSPFLDFEFVRCAFRTPTPTLMPRGQRKGLLRAVARKYFPSEIVDRPKQGFAIPIGDWFRSDYGGMKQLLLDHLNSTEPWGSPSLGIDLNMKFVQQMLSEHMNHKRDHSQRLYMLLVLSIWARGLGS